jgi:integrase
MTDVELTDRPKPHRPRRYSDPMRFPRSRSEKKQRPYWYSRVYDPVTQRRVYVNTGFKTLKHAKTWVDTQRMNEANGPERVRADRAAVAALEAKAQKAQITFKQVVEAWLLDKQERVVTEKYTVLKNRTERFWFPFFGDRPVAEVTKDDVERFLKRRKAGLLVVLAKDEKPKALTSTTANDELKALRSVFALALQEEWIERDPTKGIKHFTGSIKRGVRTLSAQEEEKLLRAATESAEIGRKGRRNVGGTEGGRVTEEEVSWDQTVTPPSYLRPVIITALGTGLRRGTLCQLEWGHLDLEERLWRIPGRFMKAKEDYTAPIIKPVLEELGRWRRELLEKQGAQAIKESARIFDVDRSSLARAFRRVVKRAGLKGLTFHSLRKAFINRCRAGGVPLEVTMKLSDHRSIATMQKHYREVSPEEARAGVETLNKALAPNKQAGEVKA